MRGVDIEAKSTVDREGWNSSTYHLYSHSGTHMDAPLHFGCTDQTIDKIPLERCIGVAWVADLTHLPPRSIITVGDPGEPAEKFEPGHSIILRTSDQFLMLIEKREVSEFSVLQYFDRHCQVVLRSQ
ncbi:MAG: cyclase family protein [Planctomycetota bacterium]